MKNNTLLIISDYSSVYGGNFIPSIFELGKGIRTKYKIYYLFPDVTRNLYWIQYIKKMGFFVFFFKKSNTLGTIRNIRAIIRKLKPKIIYTHFLEQKTKLLVPLNKSIDMYIHMHSDFSCGIKKNSFRHFLKVLIFERIIRNDAVYFFTSESMFNSSKSKNKFLIPNALCEKRIPFNSNKIVIEEIKNENNISKKDYLFMVFAWSPFVKGLDIAVNAINMLSNNKAKLIVIYGKNNGLAKCLEYLKSCGINDLSRCIFLPPSADVYSYYNLCNAFISSSRSEGFSYSILEALYCEKKVIMSNISGTKWASKYHVEVFDGSPNSLKEKMETTMNDTNLISYRNQILKDYNINDWIYTIKSIMCISD